MRFFRKRENEAQLLPADRAAFPNNATIAEKTEEAILATQVASQEIQGRVFLERNIHIAGPIQVHFMADLHFGHEAVDTVSINERLKYILETPNTFVIFLGDVIEGINPSYVGTVVGNTPANLTQQLILIREKIRKLSESNKVICAVGDYDGHTGWSRKLTTLDIYTPILDNTNIPKVQNGGRLQLNFFDPQTNAFLGKKILDLYHIPPSGSSAQNPTSGLVKESIKKKSLRADVAASGHIHKGAYSIDIRPDGNEIIAMQEGTPKGSNRDLPRDSFFVGRMAHIWPQEPGGTLTFSPSTSKSKKIIMRPGYGMSQASRIQETYEVLNYVERTGVTQELLGEIINELGIPTTKPSVRASIKEDDITLSERREDKFLDDDAENMAKIQSPKNPEDQYKRAVWRIESNLPIAVFFGAHFSIGSNTSKAKNYEKLRRDFVGQIESNPFAYIVFLRNLLDKTVAKNPDRRKIVEQTSQLFSQIAKDMRILGLMLGSEDFRQKSWQRSVGHFMNKDGPFMPGTYLSQAWATPLINHMSELEIVLGKRNQKNLPHYMMLLLDKVGNRGSSINTFNGLRSIEASYGGEIDIVAGGHMQNAGVLYAKDPYSATSDKSYVAPGHFTKWEGQGKGNRQDGSPGGQSVILYPDSKMTIPFANMEESLEFLTGAQITEGLLALGWQDKLR